MRKKIILRLSFLTVLLTLLWSCQQELLQTGQEYDSQLQQTSVERLSYAQLKRNHPLVLKKINQISPKNLSANRTVYTDTENEFSINTDEAYIVKDAKGTKTYTFKIERKAEKEEGSLENLILKDLGDGNLFGYFIKYDAIVLNNSREKPLSPEELTHHISLYAVGKKASAEIFGKLDSCPMVFYAVGSYVYADGQLCKEGLHSYGQPCAYLGTAGAATQGGYQVVYNMTMQETGGGCGVGGFEPSSGSGSMGTTPVHGGGGGNIGTVIDFDDPCTILKGNLEAAKDLINVSKVKNQNNLMKATIAADLYEKAFYFGKDFSGNDKVSDIVGGTSGSVEINLANAPFVPFGVMHNHNGNIDLGYANFSSADINALNIYVHQASTSEYLYVNGYDGSMYVMTIQDMAAFDNFVAQYPKSSIDVISNANPLGSGDWKKDLDIYTDEINTYMHFRNQGKLENEAYDLTMAYLTNKYSMGIVISKKGSDGNFHPIQVESFEITDPNTGEKKINFRQINPCNL